MKSTISILLLFVAANLPAAAEEIALKDGTKIVGHMTAVTADKIEVDTTYGKIELKKSEIVTISFPENKPINATDAAQAKADAPKIDESLQGTQYVNKTGKFSLTVPAEWIINTDIRRSPDTLAALYSRDKSRYLMVIHEEYPGSLESYKELVELNARRALTNYEHLSESTVTIDGKAGVLIFYRGTLQKGGNVPIEFVSAIIASGNTYTKLTAWCVEPLFHDVQPSFEKMLMSYRSTGQATASTGLGKP
jgi:hypothetical protein